MYATESKLFHINYSNMLQLHLQLKENKMMKKIIFQIILFLLTVFVPQLHAEIYGGIMPLDTLGDIKNRYPNAKVEKMEPAWAQDTDALYMFAGVGIVGVIVVKFNDIRPTLEKIAEENPKSSDSEFYQRLTQQSDEEALAVSWVRWVPDYKIPLQRIISKYGKPEKKGFSDDGYQPYRSWPKRGIEAYLTDDEKYVHRIDYIFTQGEYRRAYLKKYKYVPDWLKETKSRTKKK